MQCRRVAVLRRCASVVAVVDVVVVVVVCVCVSTPMMRAAVCLLYVSAVKRRRVAVQPVLHVRPSERSLAVRSCCAAVVVVC